MAIELDPGRPASSRSVSITFGHVRSPTTWGSARLMPSMKPLRKRVYAQQLCGMVRLIGQSPSERLGRTFIVENKPAAASNLATGTLVHALPDDYLLADSRATGERPFSISRHTAGRAGEPASACRRNIRRTKGRLHREAASWGHRRATRKNGCRNGASIGTRNRHHPVVQARSLGPPT